MNEPSYLMVHVKANAKHDEITHMDDAGALHVRTKALAHAGKANESVSKLVASALDIPAGTILVAQGATGPIKRLKISSLTKEELAERLHQLEFES